MFKNLILATATAAVAFTAAADFSAGTFDMTAAAEARSAGVLAQTQLKPTKPSAPSRTPSVQPSGPTTGKTPTLQPMPTIDLYGPTSRSPLRACRATTTAPSSGAALPSRSP